MGTGKHAVSCAVASLAIFGLVVAGSTPAQASSGTQQAGPRVVKMGLSSDHFLVTNTSGGEVSKYLTFDAWKALGFPDPEYVNVVPGTKLFKQAGLNSIFAVVDGREHELTRSEWASTGFMPFTEVKSAFVKYPWEEAIYAVTFLGKERKDWLWQKVSFYAWNKLGQPTPQTAGWIVGSRFYALGDGTSDIYVTTEDNTEYTFRTDDGMGGESWVIADYPPGFQASMQHKLTFAEWVAAGAPKPESWRLTTYRSGSFSTTYAVPR